MNLAPFPRTNSGFTGKTTVEILQNYNLGNKMKS